MSEYQYYEFQAIDRPLTSHEMRRLRACSTRATITATRFVNHYEWGSFKGDVEGWMGKYFDAFVYIANWGTHELALRFPRSTLDLKTARRYAGRAAAFARSSRDFVVLTLLSEVGAGSDEDWNDDGTGWLSSLTPIRSDIATGDRRALYLMWLFRAQEGEFDDDETEPPIPAGLRTLSAPLEALIEFLRINKDLVTVAAERSHAPERDSKVRHALSRWIASLPEAEKTALLLRTASGEHAAVHSELVRRHRGSSVRRDLTAVASRTVGQLLRAANRRTEERRRLDAERAASQKALRDQAIAATREKYLNNLAEHEAATWGRVEKLIATKRPGQYDEAVSLLSDLRDVGARRGRAADIATRIEQLQTKHATKPSLLARLSRAGLLSENGGRTTRGR